MPGHVVTVPGGMLPGVNPWRRLRRVLCWLSASFAAAWLLTGCGGGARTSRTQPARRATPATVTKVSAPKPIRLTVEVNGDLLIHSPVWQRARVDGHGKYDFSPMLREIAPYIKRADLAICHVETPMTPRPPTGYPVFNTPPALALAIKKAGWRICDTASNHSLDQGQYGIDQTGLALDRVGIRHTGSFATPAAQKRIVVVTAQANSSDYGPFLRTTGIPVIEKPFTLSQLRQMVGKMVGVTR